jgi:hypothetical protein
VQSGFTFVRDGVLDVRARAQAYYMSCAPVKRLAKACASLIAYTDRDGRKLSGDGTYRLTIPDGAPANKLWSLTVYDAESCTFLGSSPKVEVNSYQAGLVAERDGSVEIHMSTRARSERKANWLSLCPGRPWFAILRFDDPTDALFNKTWKPTDIERLQ